MAVARYLVDKSAWARAIDPLVKATLQPLVQRGLVATCAVIDLEILFSARNAMEHSAGRSVRKGFEWLPLTDEIGARAIEVQGLLAEKGMHREASIPDLLIAATAERHGVTVLHYDGDFDHIAAITGQPTEWVVERGSVP
ncbi:PIN domain nuclease [Streptomyces sp. CB03238]|uniref:PIN domain nuclease n=1 Tax=Streptomyces sp. CB03238 TaxID=1907777 RepID=UPI000A1117DD|nr:PIN domain nuclease [Streptomyces sp. CB03238]ORT58828.1 VapC toxin family PIN domain ribonuclease [Streptomyces sp. CB03238]